ncbi:transcription factor TGA2.2-like isoform X1 [Zingiber officinale]|uniref:transcription factor TGA2.2-like isoform X1 n=2 Tax=Zingiber officinale TaxID=94328 RepID=UPI001C4AA499|nr:transcription factor TGA2.2-like isoform X1 [Zingiber officinale]
MANNQNHRASATAHLAAPGPSSQAIARFFDDEGGGGSYFGELEEALVQLRESSSAGDRNCAATLEIFPSWPTRVRPFVGFEKKIETCRSSSDSAAAGSGGAAFMAAATAGTTTSESSRPSSLDKKNNMTGSMTGKGGKKLDAKTLRRLAQNREAAKKSRLRKKAYVQQLESSRIRLQQLEQELQRAKSQGLMVGVGGSANGAVSSGAAMFDVEYARWLDDNCKHIAGLRAALHSRLPDGNLSTILDDCIANYDHLFRLKAITVNSDVFHLLNGAWMTPAERCFLWIGGFRPSDLLKVLIPQLDPLTEQQLVGMCNLKQSSHQAEEALSQGLLQLHCSLIDTVAGGAASLSTDTSTVDVGNYMNQMVVALDKLTNLEGFVRQADNLRQQMIHQLRRTLTVRQAARCFLAIGEYYTRLRALSSLWASRPPQQDSVIGASTPPLQTLHQPERPVHFSPY